MACTSRRKVRRSLARHGRQLLPPVEHLAPLVGVEQAEQQPGQRRLAAAALADDGGDRRRVLDDGQREVPRARRCSGLVEQAAAEDLAETRGPRAGACIPPRVEVAGRPAHRAAPRGASGASVRQISIACGQRGWKGSPAAGPGAARAADRGCPGTHPSARARAGWRSAAACRGGAARRRWRRPASSTSLPAYITPSRSTNWAISPMSWPIRITAAPRSSWTAPQGLHDLPLDDDVEGAGRLVGDDHARARG